VSSKELAESKWGRTLRVYKDKSTQTQNEYAASEKKR